LNLGRAPVSSGLNVMSYAEVAVNAPVKNPRTFSYSIPAGVTVEVGHGVWVPFGSKTIQGVVCGLSEVPQVESTRDIVSVIEGGPLLVSWQVELARWISEYYFSPFFAACALMLPPGFERKVLTSVQYREAVSPEVLSSLSPEQMAIAEAVRAGGNVGLKELQKQFGQKKARLAVQALVVKGVLARTDSLEREKVKVKKVRLVSLAAGPEETGLVLEKWAKDPRHEIRVALVELLRREGRALSLAEIKSKLGVAVIPLAALTKAGIVAVEEKEVRRDPLDAYQVGLSFPPVLTPSQEAAWQKIEPALTGSGEAATFLLHGITGSGKTEIYLKAVTCAISRGKKAIVLVPEIALTPQTISRFLSRFPGRVAVLHSRLSLGEQYDEWRRIKRGECDVVVGPRSAVFAPQPDLGLIVVDEEHEWTYKQKENQPYYHARDVALKIGELKKSVVVLGSATPDLSSYYLAAQGRYRLLELPERVSLEGPAVLPPVEVVDMKKELMEGNRGLFSRGLVREVLSALQDGGQVILFLNRRGANTFVQCRDCGFVLRCRKCEVSLVYHRDENRLVCHQCNYRSAIPEQCPNCGSKKIKYLGSGTQRVEDEAALNFPGARLLRWDRDVTREKHSHEKILEQFVSHRADILVGTQMVAKGLDIPAVTVVGVVNADIGLFVPDLRAAERTFQILTQVAGRAGRGARGGKVIIQTFNPSHYAIQAASRHDYRAFYEKEMGYRREFGYPPYSRLILLTYRHANQTPCKDEAERVARLIEAEAARGIVDVQVLGPTPGLIARRRGRYEWQMILRGNDSHSVLSGMTLPQGWSVDVDPLGA